MTADPGTITNVQTAFLDTLLSGRMAVFSDAQSLMTILGGLAIALLGISHILGSTDTLAGFIKTIMKLGMFTFFIYACGPGFNNMKLLDIILKGFVRVGTEAGGGNVAIDVLNDPSQIITLGKAASQPIYDSYSKLTGLAALAALPLWLSGLLVRFTYFVLALQVFLCRIEFAIVAAVGIIFLPFGVLKHTAFLAEKFISGVISFGIKLMVLACIISITFPVLKTFTLPPNPQMDDIFSLLFAVGAIALLGWQAPGIASAVLAGSPSLTAGTSAQGAVAAGMVAASAVTGVGAATAATKGASALAGAAKAGYTHGGVSGAIRSTGGAVMQNITDAHRGAFKGGQEKATSALEGKASNSQSPGTAATSSGSPESRLKNSWQRGNVPPEEKAGPGAGVSLSGEEE